jgi:CRP-like cAMP-binding protein
MISPELLRRYRFFWCMDDGQQKAVAMISQEATVAEGATICKENETADHLYFLLDGGVELSVMPGERRLFVGYIAPGEPFGLCALLHDQTHTYTAQANKPSRVITIDATELRNLCVSDCSLGMCLMQQVARATLAETRTTHMQLAGVSA